MKAPVVLLATMDTKAAEVEFLRAELLARGHSVRVVDVGLSPVDDGVDAPARVVAAAAGQQLEELRAGARRDEAMAVMAAGAHEVLGRWHAAGELAGVLALGGNQGTSIAAAAMRELPYGIPKLIVSTVASGNVREYVGDSDVTLMFSVADLLGGANPVVAGVLRRAAAAMAGMAAAGAGDALAETHGDHRPLVALTAFGNTHGAVTAAMSVLSESDVSAVPFHASGACGSAMERLIDSGMFHGVLDLTTHELLGELFPADIYAPVRPGRLTAAGRAGIPQVVAPGGLEYHCFGGAGTIPAELRNRPTHYHNPNNTNVRATADELVTVAEELAERLNASTGAVAVLVPALGWSAVGSPGGVLHDPAANEAFTRTLRARLSSRVVLRELETTINDPVFATTAAETLLELLRDHPAARRELPVQ
ncbi:Tm-1-like ATP-binding domain-containing protein [Allosalinactinospora lopnorensis]|uniref:Tm-1-like ATP-binding domain-containing protein n=1 Tax=Allosalinactinospora lopnorensis TaxID=1352348 RepID=UPI000623BC8C|nr:Tm-1-like ATP-binding domain-containing protein [Allosalinactinospora lopnorensis]